MSNFSNKFYNRFLLFVTGLGGLLYGIDIGIIDPALTYLNQSVKLSESQLSYVVAAVLAGSILGSVVAGVLADWLGRKVMMIISGLMFVGSVAIIYVSQSFEPLMIGRLLQGMSGGVTAVVVPLYLAECLPSNNRGRGIAVFQFMLTIGIVLAAFIGNYYISNAERLIQSAGGDKTLVLAAADHAWRSMFLSVVYPGMLFLLGAFFISESPRWLVRHGKNEAANLALRRLSQKSESDDEYKNICKSLADEKLKQKVSFFVAIGEIFTERRYVMPFLLACVILGCNQATGINSLLQFMSTILQKSGLDPVTASSYGTGIKIINSVMTIAAIILVERKGRVFLLKLGTSGICISLLLLAGLFYSVESKRIDVLVDVQAMVTDNKLSFDIEHTKFARVSSSEPLQISILYNYGNKQQVAEAFMPTAESEVILANAKSIVDKLPLSDQSLLFQADELKRENISNVSSEARLIIDQAREIINRLPQESKASLESAKRIKNALLINIKNDPSDLINENKPLEILRARVEPIPSRHNGLIAALCLAAFISFFSIGPGVCVWLALSELMPTRIRSVGMGVALLVNQGVSTAIAAAFLPIVGNYGFYAMFLFWAGCTVIYFVTAAFFLPETKGKTLEEIETFFVAKKEKINQKLG
jgi:SP family myo-inositol transporter-like MFS transporter 13